MQLLTPPQMSADPNYDHAGALAEAGHHLGRSLADYNQCSAAEESPAQTRTMVHAFHRILTLALPHAPVDVLEALIELCATETARTRLEHQADDGTLAGARILNIGG